VTVVAFETMSVATIMPDVRAELGGIGLYGWAFSGLALGEIVGIVIAGAWADKTNPVRPIMAGLVVYTIGLIISGIADSMFVVVVGRVLQGYGAGTVPAVAYVCVARGFDESQRARVFAWMSSAWVIPSIVGPGAAGLIAHQFGWRWVFLGLIPIVLGVGALAIRPIWALGNPATSDPDRSTGRTIMLAGVAVVATAVALGGFQVDELAILALCLVSGGTALVWAFRQIAPSGTLRLRRGMPATVAVRGLLTFAFLGADAFVTLALTDVRGTSTRFAGMVLSSAAISWTAGSFTSARLIAKVGPRVLVTSGLCFIVAGIATMSVIISTSISPWFAFGSWLLSGLGMGLAYSPLSQAVLSAAAPGQLGAATSALQLSDVLGFALGTGFGGALIALADRHDVEVGGSTVHGGVNLVWIVTGAIGVLGVFASRRMSRYLGGPSDGTSDDAGETAAASAVAG